MASNIESCQLSTELLRIPPARRGSVLQAAVAFRPSGDLDQEFEIGPLRAAFAEYWEEQFAEPISIKGLQAVLARPVPIATVMAFCRLNVVSNSELQHELRSLMDFLRRQVSAVCQPSQPNLFPTRALRRPEPTSTCPFAGTAVNSLEQLLSGRCKYSAIYADPPWAYSNRACKGAADKQYRTMSVADITRLPIADLAASQSHLHLWTTNGFLREAFDVIEAWGFQYKSCFVWIKDRIGMGNYWRVSHEFLMLGIRGDLTFADRTLPSWLQAERTIHSRKPAAVRALVERASPGPYLELFGREELPDSQWTVFGDQVEKKMF